MEERSLMLNAFRPSTETVSPARFAGRVQEVLTLVDTLMTEGTCPLIYGDRGLGKSSLAYQVARIGLGDIELLSLLQKENHKISGNDYFHPIWFTCSDEVKTKNDLIEAIINTASGYSKYPLMNGNNVKEIFCNGDIHLAKHAYEASKKIESLEGRRYNEVKTEEKFQLVVRELQKSNSRLLFIIDELDRVHNTSGLGSFIKNNSSRNVKFLLVGVSNNISNLLKDHSSVDRQLMPVKVNEMSPVELEAIISKTEQNLNDSGLKIKFEEDAVSKLVSSADGFPWFIHVLGQEALKIMWDDNRRVLYEDDVLEAIQILAKSRFAQHFSDMYTRSVGESMHRERVLRLMAKWKGDDIPLSDIYRLAKKVSVANPSQCKKDLVSSRYGKVIYTPSGTGANVVRFTNAMFKRYINLRQAIYQGVASEIHTVWRDNGYSAFDA